jgi:hypothetical protein
MSGDTNPLLILLGLFILGGVLWWNAGGPNREQSQRPFLQLRTPTANPVGETADQHATNTNQNNEQLTPAEIARQIEQVRKEIKDVEDALRKLEAEKDRSAYSSAVVFERAAAQTSDPAREYLIVRTNTSGVNEPINITGWRIASLITGRSAQIGRAADKPYLGRVNQLDDIVLSAGSRVYINTGHSPTGISMRLNRCTGYFEQFQNWTPGLPRECPAAKTPGYFPYPPNALSDECLDYIERIPRCTMPTSVPLFLENACGEWIQEHFNYSACVDEHSSDQGFYKNEWRLYLERDEELWKAKREVIELRDHEGKLVGSVSY